MRKTAVVSLLCSLALASCMRTTASTSPRADRDTITHDQMAEARFQTVYDAVEALHSNWLQARGPDSFSNPSEVRVYLDNSLLGGTTKLHEIAANTVTWVKHYDGVAATARWGLDHGAGVIYVSTYPSGAGSGTP